ncbi:hypothetical protein [Paucidesulfovibrio longus]|uniref:hypothetical protein n=1 Tax=Paucidesulfovibrio longus TaxID=889 RepID=UPI0003B5A899|nr:hypothetical protein [Paucidesulfovibrio longus]
MTCHYNPNNKRIVCKWTEPVKFVMNKKEGVLSKVRTINVNVNKDGRLKSRDEKRHADHPMFPIVRQFSDELRRINFFDVGQKHACEHCGSEEAVTPYFDVAERRLTWRCADPIRCSQDSSSS